MPKQVDVAEQRRTIRHAARRVFLRRGVAGTGLTHVAEAAGMGRSSLYHYYPDKQALLRDLVKQVLAEEREVFERVLRGGGSPRARVESLLRVLVALFDEYAGALRMVSELRLRDGSAFRGFFRSVRAELAAVVAAGQEQGEFDAALDPDLAAAVLIGAVDGLVLQYFVDARARMPLDAVSAELVRFARKALAP